MDLGVAIVGNIYFRSHNGKTFGLDSLGKMPQFLAREQKFAVSERFVAAPGRSPVKDGIQFFGWEKLDSVELLKKEFGL